ncbi:glycosyltransferase [Nocardioides sp. R-C-SC26]|uniref:glycosyltransferase family 2 protein n=1 Tax=Nocardioides sp. R-C-SC26 TaxID=2870414 RepID=UPI001E40F232|nr:glycosyltransferase [Nocardioides sp. R-C-SC26]
MPLRRRRPLLSVVVPVYNVEAYLAQALASVLAQTYRDLDVVVVDDGSTDGSGALADELAATDPRVRVVHTENRGLGAARNEGIRHARGDLLTFADSDDVVPETAYAALTRQLRRTGSDLVTGSIAWWRPEEPSQQLVQPPWMRRLHRTRAAGMIDQMPELLGDVFAWNKVFTRAFWDRTGLTWLEGHRYEDQPTATRAYLAAARVGVIPEVVYHWRIRTDGSSITQQRASLDDLADRWLTKRLSLRHVEEYGSAKVTRAFRDLVLPGDLHRYFVLIPGCDDAWYAGLEEGVDELFGRQRSLVYSGLPPAHRLTGWLVEQGRRADAVLVQERLAALAPGERLPRVTDSGGLRLDVPGLDADTVLRAALEVRAHER